MNRKTDEERLIEQHAFQGFRRLIDDHRGIVKTLWGTDNGRTLTNLVKGVVNEKAGL